MISKNREGANFMSDSFGKNLRITIFGENNSDAIGVVMEGIEPRTPIDLHEVRKVLNRQRKMQCGINQNSEYDYDICRVLSGYKDAEATGTPFVIMMENGAASPLHPDGVLRPSTFDFGAVAKYGDMAGDMAAGHMTERVQTAITAAGAVARQILWNTRGILIGAHIANIGKAQDRTFASEEITPDLLQRLGADPFPVISLDVKGAMLLEIKEALDAGDTLGGSVECAAIGVPAGLGEPAFRSMQSSISQIMFSLCDVCGVEFGLGFYFCNMTGSRANDAFMLSGGSVKKRTNNSGGVAGPLTDGGELYLRVGFRPCPDIGQKQKTVDLKAGQDITYVPEGPKQKKDICSAFSALCTVEGALALAILDMLL
jgi:chorismate synthase